MTAKGRAPLIEKALWRVRRLILPRPVRGEDAARIKGPVVIAGFFRTASGVGQSVRSCAAALERDGVNPTCVDLSGALNQIDMEADRALSEMPGGPEGILILHANAPETERAIFKLGLRRRNRWRIIGVWAWELATPPPTWLPAARRLSEIWTLSEFVANAFRGRVTAPVKRVLPYIVVPDGVRPDRTRFAVAQSELLCLAMADGRSSFERKNILGAVRIFRAAAGDRGACRMIVKTRNIAEYPEFAALLAREIGGDRRIGCVDGSLSEADRWSLLASADIFLSPHRAEGFGLVLAEAMALGKAVLATGWSGNLDFMTEESAALIPFALKLVPDALPVYGATGHGAVWADPDESAAAAALRELMENAGRRAALGAAARRTIREKLDGRGYAAALSSDQGFSDRRET